MVTQKRKWIVVIAAVVFASCGCQRPKSVQKASPPDLSARYVQLTHPPKDFYDEQPIWAPTGQAVYFERTPLLTEQQMKEGVLPEIWRCDLASGTEKMVARGQDAALSPDGKRMAYSPFEKGDAATGPVPGAITVLDLGTGQTTALSHGGPGISLSWSPDGRKLLYGWVTPTALRILDLRTDKETMVGVYPIVGGGYWSPDGRLIAYLTQGSEKDRLAFLRWYRLPGHAGVVSGKDAVEQRHLLRALDNSATLHLLQMQSGKDEAVAGLVPVGSVMSHSTPWSPDGTALVVAARSGKDSTGIFRVTVATGKAQPLTPGPDDREAAWSPDGTRVAYTKYSGTGKYEPGPGKPDYHIAVLDLRTHRETVFTGRSLRGPHWSPDSKYLACEGYSQSASGTGIWIINTEAGEPKQK